MSAYDGGSNANHQKSLLWKRPAWPRLWDSQNRPMARVMKYSHASKVLSDRTIYRARFGSLGTIAILAVLFSLVVAISVAEKLPPAPSRYFNDYASLVRPEVAEQ